MSDINSNLPVNDTSDGTAGAAAPSIVHQVGGKDGSGNLQPLKIDAQGGAIFAGEGTAGTSTGGVLTIQGIASGTDVPTLDSSDGPVAPGTVASSSSLAGGQFNTSLPTLTNTQQAALQVDSSGRLIISPVTSGTLAGGSVTTNPPTYVNNATDPLSLTIDGDLRVADIINTSGQYRAQSVTTSAAEALGAATILANRKSLTITPTNGTVYFGTSNGVTTTTGTPIFKNQSISFAIGSSLHIYVISAGTVDCRMIEGS